MKIKLDHNLSRHLQAVLEGFGHDVDTAFDEGLARATDKEFCAKLLVRVEFYLRWTQIF